MQCLINEETDTSQIMTQQMQIEKRIDEMASKRDSGEPQRVAAVSDSDDGFSPFPFIGGGGGY